ncbi:MAG: mercury methylation ferredoxin HgcB [Planctomycetota bacterium]|jgi:NAD-dependent dihydropyrimidine dehydrogenase PreA subunit
MYEENTLYFDRELCTDCGMCIRVCPHEVFAQHNGQVRLADRSACMECGACQMNCPFDAVTVDSGVGCAAALMYQAVMKKKQPSCEPVHRI